jgi:hypothetical protein
MRTKEFLTPNFGATCKPLSLSLSLSRCRCWVVGRNFGLGSTVDGPAQCANHSLRVDGVVLPSRTYKVIMESLIHN